MRYTVIIAALLVASCAKSPAELETQDDATCRGLVTQRNDTRPNAYAECRANMMAYRTQRSIAVSGR